MRAPVAELAGQQRAALDRSGALREDLARSASTSGRMAGVAALSVVALGAVTLAAFALAVRARRRLRELAALVPERAPAGR